MAMLSSTLFNKSSMFNAVKLSIKKHINVIVILTILYAVTTVLSILYVINSPPIYNYDLSGNIQAVYQSNMTETTGYVVQNDTYTPVNDDPQIRFEFDNELISGIKVVFSAPLKNETHTQVYFDDNGVLSEPQSVIIIASKGATEIFFEIPVAEYNIIRIDIDGVVSIKNVYISDELLLIGTEKSVRFSFSYVICFIISNVVITIIILTLSKYGKIDKICKYLKEKLIIMKQNRRGDKMTVIKKQWIDVIKAVAIIAVVIDHSYRLLYDNSYIQQCSFFSVTVFIFLSGITSFYSISRRGNDFGLKETFRRIKPILIPYIFATAIYLICANNFFDFKTFWNSVINFNASPPFYFVLFYIQLVIISPLLYHLINRFEINVRRARNLICANVLLLAVVIFAAFLSVNYTFVLNVHGGGKFLFGGTYLIIYYLGMLFGKYEFVFDKMSKHIRVAFMIISGMVLTLFLLFYLNNSFKIDSYVPFGSGFNPPSVTLFTYSILIFLFLYSMITLTEQYRIPNKIGNYVSIIGKNSLYIFLYHLLILQIMRQYIIENVLLLRVTYLSAMIIIPIILKHFCHSLKNFIGLQRDKL